MDLDRFSHPLTGEDKQARICKNCWYWLIDERLCGWDNVTEIDDPERPPCKGEDWKNEED